MTNLFISLVALPFLVAAVLAWVITISVRAKRAHAMINQVYEGTCSSRRPVLLPTTVKAGDPLLVGTEPCVALDSYQANIGGATCLFNGSFSFSVTAKSSLSPSVGLAIKPGDKIYADGGVLDAATNVTTGFTLDANSSTGVFFGRLDPSAVAILTTVTNAAATVLVAQI